MSGWSAAAAAVSQPPSSPASLRVGPLLSPMPDTCRPISMEGKWNYPAPSHSALRQASNIQLRRSIRSEEHTSELQSLRQLVCLLLLGKKGEEEANGSRAARQDARYSRPGQHRPR